MFSWDADYSAQWVIAASSGDSGGMSSEDFFLCRNLWDGQGRRADVALGLRFSSRRFVGRDSDSIYSGDRERRDGRDLRGDLN
jgi:hypothetical protein